MMYINILYLIYNKCRIYDIINMNIGTMVK